MAESAAWQLIDSSAIFFGPSQRDAAGLLLRNSIKTETGLVVAQNKAREPTNSGFQEPKTLRLFHIFYVWEIPACF